MSSLQAIVLGVVQGLTEFVPVSSSGHLVVVPELFGWSEPGVAFDVLLHGGSLVALLIYFSGDLVDLVRGFLARDPAARRLVLLLAIGTVPAGFAGVALSGFFEDRFDDPPAAALSLLATAAILVAGERLLAHHERRAATTGARLRTMHDLRIPDAILVGGAQALAILPGVSRSGSTIAAGLARGVGRDEAARFAFLLGIPALAGAALVQLPDLHSTGLGLGAGLLGFLASAVVSYAAISSLLRYLGSNTLYPFAAYCLIAAPVLYLLVR